MVCVKVVQDIERVICEAAMVFIAASPGVVDLFLWLDLSGDSGGFLEEWE